MASRKRLPTDADPFTFVRMMRAMSGSVNRVRLGRLRAGGRYLVPTSVAWYLVAVGAAALERARAGRKRSLALVVEPSVTHDPPEIAADDLDFAPQPLSAFE